MSILIIILLFLVVLSLWGFYNAVKPPRLISPVTPKDLGLDYEDVSFITKDNIKIAGWFIPNQQKSVKKTIILLHGYPADKGNILPALAFLRQSHNLLFFDFRYFGQSGGSYSTAGAKETEDLLAAVRFLKSRGIEEIGVWGFSMGGAVALMTANRAPEIKTVVAESSYARLSALAPALYGIPILKYPLGILTSVWAKLFLNINAWNVAPAESAKNLNKPVLIIHSKNDEVIPFAHALLIQKDLENNPRAEFWFKENLIHGQLGEEYQKRIGEFFKKHL